MDYIIFYSMNILRTFHIPSAVYISRNGTAGHINGSSNISIFIYGIAVIPIYMFQYGIAFTDFNSIVIFRRTFQSVSRSHSPEHNAASSRRNGG